MYITDPGRRSRQTSQCLFLMHSTVMKSNQSMQTQQAVHSSCPGHISVHWDISGTAGLLGCPGPKHGNDGGSSKIPKPGSIS